jgi:hypothetical protein
MSHDSEPVRFFVSYARGNSDFVLRLGRDLKQRGFNFWIDQLDIPKGAHWDQSVQEALQDCQSVLLVLSPEAVASQNVLDEVRYARDQGKRIVPVLFRNCKIPFWLWRLQYTDFTGDYDAGIRALDAALVERPPDPVLVPREDSPVAEESLAATSKNIVVCCDDGWQNPMLAYQSNTYELARMAVSRSDRQRVYYDPGLESLPGLAQTWRRVGSLLTPGSRHAQHVEYAYEFLIDNFKPGDRLFLFGSGAGGVRVSILATLLERCGLLAKGGRVMIRYALALNERAQADMARNFKSAFSTECSPHFIGLWDATQGVSGWLNRSLRHLTLSPRVPFAYHAISLDERRWMMSPALWDESIPPGQLREQVWFPGVHSDVSGGYPEKGLSSLALQWMADKASASGLLLDKEGFESIRPDPLDLLHESYRGLWRLYGGRKRRVPAGASVHSSAYRRVKEDRSYRPSNLPPPEAVKVVEE